MKPSFYPVLLSTVFFALSCVANPAPEKTPLVVFLECDENFNDYKNLTLCNKNIEEAAQRLALPDNRRDRKAALLFIKRLLTTHVSNESVVDPGHLDRSALWGLSHIQGHSLGTLFKIFQGRIARYRDLFCLWLSSPAYMDLAQIMQHKGFFDSDDYRLLHLLFNAILAELEIEKDTGNRASYLAQIRNIEESIAILAHKILSALALRSLKEQLNQGISYTEEAHHQL